MPPAPKPADEPQRLAAIDRCGARQVRPSAALDAVAESMAERFAAPVALVSVLDSENQFFLGQRGFEGHSQVHRDDTFCGYTILDNAALVVGDATQDERFADNVFVTGGEGIRFYAGVPLVTSDGWRIGTACVLDRSPGGVDDPGVRALWRHATIATQLIEDVGRIEAERNRAERMESEARDAVRERSLFIASMSHELKTPLNAVMGFADVLCREVYGPLGSPRYRTYARYILDGGQHLLSLLDDLLDLCRLDSGQLALRTEAVDVTQEIEWVRHLQHESARGKHIQLKLAVEGARPRVRSDRRALRQVLLNLVSNAIKYTHAGDAVVVRARTGDDGFCRISVADNGPGIDGEEVDRLLQPFQRAATPGGAAGAGLGLAIARRLVEANGGTLEIESTLGAGTTVVTTWPLAEAAGSGNGSD